MFDNVFKHMEEISEEQVISLSDFQEIKIVSNNETISHIKKLSKETGLSISRVVEAMIRAALETKQAAG